MEGLLGKILIVDDDENICEVIKMYLETTGYNVKVAHDGKAAKEEFVNFSPNLVVLDMMLPGIDGMEVLKWIRKDSNVPVIMLTAKGETFDKVLALEIGADDYVVKPFEPKELLARVKAVMRRYSGEEPDNVVLNFPGLTIDANSYKVIYNGEEVKTPPKEFELLHYLASNKNKVFTRDQLLCEVWGYDYPGDSRTVDVHIKRLREKLNGGEDWQLETFGVLGINLR